MLRGIVDVGSSFVPRPQPRDLDDDEVVTQYGCRAEIGPIKPPFHCRPRVWNDEPGLSVILGDHSVQQAAYYVRGRATPAPEDGVRHSTVGRLRKAGFTVTHTPTLRNPHHATVSVPHYWEDDEDTAFDSCFDSPMWAAVGGDPDE